MTVTQIIADLYISKDLDDCIKKVVRKDLWDDFKQELFLIIAGIPEERITTLHEKNHLRFYIVRCIINLSRSRSHSFHKKYLDVKTVYEGEAREENTDGRGYFEGDPASNKSELSRREQEEEKELLLLAEVARLDERFNSPFYRQIAEAVVKHGSMREASRQTGIHVSSISRAVKQIREHLQTV